MPEIGKLNACVFCILNSPSGLVLCKQVDCETNSVIISEEVIE